ncbi:MAG: hypothetical protein CMK28_02240 [Porticoccaceae bacterium]|nr:hypothetical protein [Porticoccaceae bacterium]
MKPISLIEIGICEKINRHSSLLIKFAPPEQMTQITITSGIMLFRIKAPRIIIKSGESQWKQRFEKIKPSFDAPKILNEKIRLGLMNEMLLEE